MILHLILVSLHSQNRLPLHKGVGSAFESNMAVFCWEGWEMFAFKGESGRNKGVTFEILGLRKFSLVFGLVGSIL